MQEEKQEQSIIIPMDIDIPNTIPIHNDELYVKDIEDIGIDINALPISQHENKVEEEEAEEIAQIEDDKMIMDEQQEPGKSHKKERNNLIRLPLAKIKNTMKLDSDIKLCQKNAYYVIGRLTELFIQEIAKKSHNICKMSKRKTINIDDINTAIKGVDKYSFIDIASIFHVDILGSSKDKRSKSNQIIQNQLLSGVKEPIENKGNEDNIETSQVDKKKSNNKEKKPTNKKTTPIANNNMRIDQMFSK